MENGMKRLTICAMFAGLCAVAVFFGDRHAPAQQRQDQAVRDDAAQLQALQKERIKMLSATAKRVETQFKLGAADYQQFVAAETELVNAEVEYSESPEERVGYLEKGSQLAKAIADIAEKRFKSGYIQTEVPVFRLKAVYLDLQIRLLKERQKLAAAKARQ